MARRSLLFIMILLLSNQIVAAFGTIELLGQSAEHEKITEQALKPFKIDPWTLSEIKGRKRVFGAVGVPDKPSRGLLFEAAAHCDNGDTLDFSGYPQDRETAAKILSSCRQWMMDHLRVAVEAGGQLVNAAGAINSPQKFEKTACAFNGKLETTKCNVLAALGLVFHAAQDFYSHTNWTDIARGGKPSVSNPPGLGNDKRAPWLDPRLTMPMPSGLISGCFVGIPEILFCKRRVRHAVLNKDTGAIERATGAIGEGTTDRAKGNNNFARAVRAAIEDTRDKWAYFEEQIVVKHGESRGRIIICVVRRDDPSSCR
jgi:hypothetical protein